MRTQVRVAIALASVLLVTAVTHAQNIFGSIVGTVSDATGAVLPNASVTVTNMGTGQKRNAPTDGQGNYQILSLPRGEYKIDMDAMDSSTLPAALLTWSSIRWRASTFRWRSGKKAK